MNINSGLLGFSCVLSMYPSSNTINKTSRIIVTHLWPLATNRLRGRGAIDDNIECVAPGISGSIVEEFRTHHSCAFIHLCPPKTGMKLGWRDLNFGTFFTKHPKWSIGISNVIRTHEQRQIHYPQQTDVERRIANFEMKPSHVVMVRHYALKTTKGDRHGCLCTTDIIREQCRYGRVLPPPTPT